MKSFFYFASTVCAFLIISCTNKEKAVESPMPDTVSEAVDVMKPTNLYKVKPQDTISVAQFELWTDNWKKSVGKNPVTKDILYFSMPVIDFSELLGEVPFSTRLYLGLDETVKPNKPHILLIGVDSLGNNMIGENGNVYDVSQPCPPACG